MTVDYRQISYRLAMLVAHNRCEFDCLVAIAKGLRLHSLPRIPQGSETSCTAVLAQLIVLVPRLARFGPIPKDEHCELQVCKKNDKA